MVLYLDLDGVVQHEAVLYHPKRGIYMSPIQTGRVLFEWIPILEGILRPYPDVALVLSSTWCIRPGYAKTLERLPSSLGSRFIGGTYHRPRWPPQTAPLMAGQTAPGRTVGL